MLATLRFRGSQVRSIVHCVFTIDARRAIELWSGCGELNPVFLSPELSVLPIHYTPVSQGGIEPPSYPNANC